MNYFTYNQAECIIKNYIPIFYQHADNFNGFEFETIVKVLVNMEDKIYLINVIITEFGAKTSRDLEIHEFCNRYKIPLDYSECL